MATIGSGENTFDIISDWAKLPDDWDAPMAAVTVDSQDRVYGFNRGARGVIVFDKDGNYVSDWEGVDFVFPHAIYADPSDNIWIVDRDAGQILKYSTDGELPAHHRRARLPLGYGRGQLRVQLGRPGRTLRMAANRSTFRRASPSPPERGRVRGGRLRQLPRP